MTAFGKVLLAAGGLILAISMNGGFNTDTNSTANIPADMPVISVRAEELFNYYNNNEVQTDLWLKGHMVEISGVVNSITKDAWGYLRVGLMTPNRFESASMQVVESQESQLADLHKGQMVTLRCPKMKRWAGTPYGDDCVLTNH